MAKETLSRSLAKRIVENSFHDKKTNTLFVTNPGISADLLHSLALKNNFKIGQTKSGEYISIPMSVKSDEFEDKYVSQFDAFLDTYTYFSRNYHTLLTAYKTFDLMEENMGEVDLILSTYVEEVLSSSFVEEPLKIKISNAKASDIVDKVLRKNKIFARLSMIVRNIAKYGNMGFTLSYPYLETNNGEYDDELKEIDVVRDLVITPVNPKYFKVTCDNYFNVINYTTNLDDSYNYTNGVVSTKTRTWQPWQFTHFLIYSEITEPYGQSMLWSMRSSFDQLTTLEALLAVSRASKVQRLVITVPVPPEASTMDAYQYINEVKGNYLNSLFTDAPGTKAGRKIPAATSILVKPAVDGFDIDHIESNIDLSSTDDVDYFLDKILRNSKLPKGYLVGDDTITTSQTLESQDLKLSRALIPLKQALLDGMVNLIENIMVHAGFDVSKIDVEVTLNKPIQISNDSLAKYGDMLELVKSAEEINSMNTINKFQFLVELGMPIPLARLTCSNTPISVIKNTEDLEKFLKNQVDSGVSSSHDDEMEECVQVDMRRTSKQFLKEHYNLSEEYQDIFNEMKQIADGKQRKILYENVFTAKIPEKTQD